ncbi:MAG: damage-control phosphatase ARMT1 family protein [Promethearchaeota archaeon]|jgi:uncharacterized protein with ATP-grasp and redox domains
MKLEPECIGCLFNQILQAFRLLRPDISQEIVITAQKRLMSYLINFKLDESASPILGKVTYNIVSDLMKDNDPYHALKIEYNNLVLKKFDQIMEVIEEAEDPLKEAILASALGNTIDFASQHDIDIVSDLKNILVKDLVINDYLDFRKSLESTNHLLIIGDNAGEIVFDKILIITLKKYYPDLEIVYAVRSAPIINDVTIDDAKLINLTDLIQVIEANDAPGIIISETSNKFKKHFFKKNGVILSKGQGNFESLLDIQITDKSVYYLMKIKCNLMERIFKAKIGDLIFKRKTNGF